MARSANPEAQVAGRDFARALCDCAAKLAPRSRVIWLFRVFYQMPSKQIASHPEVNLMPGHVDVLLQRCRQAIRNCMRQRGFTAGDMPPGTFIEIWKAFRLSTGGGAQEAEDERSIRRARP